MTARRSPRTPTPTSATSLHIHLRHGGHAAARDRAADRLLLRQGTGRASSGPRFTLLAIVVQIVLGLHRVRRSRHRARCTASTRSIVIGLAEMTARRVDAASPAVPESLRQPLSEPGATSTPTGAMATGRRRRSATLAIVGTLGLFWNASGCRRQLLRDGHGLRRPRRRPGQPAHGRHGHVPRRGRAWRRSPARRPGTPDVTVTLTARKEDFRLRHGAADRWLHRQRDVARTRDRRDAGRPRAGDAAQQGRARRRCPALARDRRAECRRRRGRRHPGCRAGRWHVRLPVRRAPTRAPTGITRTRSPTTRSGAACSARFIVAAQATSGAATDTQRVRRVGAHVRRLSHRHRPHGNPTRGRGRRRARARARHQHGQRSPADLGGGAPYTRAGRRRTRRQRAHTGARHVCSSCRPAAGPTC